MTIQLATKFAPYVDELFSAESKAAMVTNNDYDFTGAHTIKVYKIGTAAMTDYGRNAVAEGSWSHYGAVATLDATTETLELSKDRSFTFEIDKLDADETAGALQAADALNRQIRNVVIPEVDTRVYAVMCANAGTKPTAAALTAANIYGEILKGSTALDNAGTPDTDRFILVDPTTYALMKQSSEIILNTNISDEQRKSGVIGMLDGAAVIKVPAGRLPAKFGFLYGHPSATVAPQKLTDYKVHEDPPGLSGSLVEGRVCYDAFVLENKATALYYQATV